MVPRLECRPSDISGISSSTTTYNIAPAAKLNRYGKKGMIKEAIKMVSNPATGSTIPDKIPCKHALNFDIPFARSGMENSE